MDEESINEGESAASASIEELEQEVYFKTLEDTPHIFEEKTTVKGFLVLRPQFRNLAVYLHQIILMAFGKSVHPSFQAWQVA